MARMTAPSSIRDHVAEAVEGGPIGRLRRVLVSVVRGFLADDVLGLSGELAYRWLLSIFPLAIMIAAISGFAAQSLGIQDPTSELIDAAGSSLPPEAAATIRPQLEQILDHRDGALLSLGLLLTIYAASSGMKALMKGLNRAYDVEEGRPFLRQMTIALALTLILGTAVVASFIVMVSGQVAAKGIATSLGLGEAAAWFFEIAPYPLAILALGVASAFLYWAAPARHPGWRSVLPGVVVFVPGWILATILFSFYVANFASYDNTYGALGGIIILLLWFYLTAVILLFGGELNAAIDHERGHDQLAAAEQRGDAAAGEPLAHRGADSDG